MGCREGETFTLCAHFARFVALNSLRNDVTTTTLLVTDDLLLHHLERNIKVCFSESNFKASDDPIASQPLTVKISDP